MNTLAHAYLTLFSGHYLIALIIWALILLHTKHHWIAHQALFLLLSSIALAIFVKPYFHIPLPPHLSGYAYPSGHMLATTAFWGTIAYHAPRRLSYILLILLMFYGASLILCHYHNLYDVSAGAAFAGVLIALWSYLTLHLPRRILMTVPFFIYLILALSQTPHGAQIKSVLLALAMAWPLLDHFEGFIPTPITSLCLILPSALLLFFGLLSPTPTLSWILTWSILCFPLISQALSHLKNKASPLQKSP